MSAKKKPWLIGLIVIVYSIVIFWFGIAAGMRSNRHQLAQELDSTQAMLAFNRLLDERRLQSLLLKGCAGAALERTNISMDQDTRLLASLFKGRLSPWVAKYVKDRDLELLNSLPKFKSKYGDSWKEPECSAGQRGI